MARLLTTVAVAAALTPSAGAPAQVATTRLTSCATMPEAYLYGIAKDHKAQMR